MTKKSCSSIVQIKELVKIDKTKSKQQQKSTVPFSCGVFLVVA